PTARSSAREPADMTHPRLISRRDAFRLAGAAGLAATALGATGCGSGSTSNPAEDHLQDLPETFNATGFPIVDEPLTIRFMTAKDPDGLAGYNGVASWKKYQSMTNVTVDWGLVPNAAMKEKVNLALASGDYPEVLYGAALPSLEMVRYGD